MMPASLHLLYTETKEEGRLHQTLIDGGNAMNPRENLNRLLEGGVPDWMPFSLDVGAIPGLTEPVQQRFRDRTGRDDWASYFEADFRLFSLRQQFGGDDPAALHGPLPPGITFDEWGIGHWAGGSEGTVERLYPPLAAAQAPKEIEALPLPVIETVADTAVIDSLHAAGYPVLGYAGSIYEWSWWLRGMETFLMDLVAAPALAEAIIARVAEHTRRLALASAQLGIDVLCFYDDVGMQSGMQIAPALWRRYIKPAWRRVLEAVRAEAPRARFFLHSCGRIDPILPDIVELGFDALHPVQPECMDFEAVFRQYGGNIVLSASLSSQRTLPFGSAADVRGEVRRLAGIVGGSRRGILMPSNRIQPETPWENIIAFAEEARLLRVRSEE
jgi:uroporphyrinogen decarboxylase